MLNKEEIKAVAISMIIRSLMGQFDVFDKRRPPMVKIFDALRRKHSFLYANRRDVYAVSGYVAVDSIMRTNAESQKSLYISATINALYFAHKKKLDKMFRLNEKYFDKIYDWAMEDNIDDRSSLIVSKEILKNIDAIIDEQLEKYSREKEMLKVAA